MPNGRIIDGGEKIHRWTRLKGLPSLRCLRAGSKKGVNWSEKESWKHPGFYARFFHFMATRGHSKLNPTRFLQTTPLSAVASEESSLPQKPLGKRGSEIQESTRAWSPPLRPFGCMRGRAFLSVYCQGQATSYTATLYPVLPSGPGDVTQFTLILSIFSQICVQ